MLIVMLNFLIAEVGNTYQKASALGEKYHYRERSILNHQAQKYMYFFSFRHKYTAIAFTTPREAFKDQDDEDQKDVFSIQEVIKNELDKAAKNMKKELRSMKEQIGAMITQESNR